MTIDWRRLALLLLVLAGLAGGAGAGRAAEPAAVAPDPRAIEATFKDGLEALEAGDTERAIRRFTAILARDPRLHRVRLELARAYFLAEDWADARREFFAVLSADVPDPVRANIIRFLRLIDIRRGWSWTFDAGLRGGPDEGRRYTSDTVKLNIGGVPLDFAIDTGDAPDYGAFAAGSLEFRQPLAELPAGTTLSGIARGFGQADVYEGSDYDEQLFGAALLGQLAWARTTLTLGPDLLWRRLGGDPREDRLGGAATIEHRLPEGLAFFGRVGYARIDDRLSDLRDGDLWTGRVGVSRSLGGRAALTGILGLTGLDAEEPSESYRSGRVELRAAADLGRGWAPTLALAVARTRYRERGALFFERRRDWQFAADLEVEKRNLFIGPFSPFAAIGYTRNTSNIELHDYHETRFRVGLRKIF